MCIFCATPKCRTPYWGDTSCERFFFVLTCISACLAFVELPALIKYAQWFDSGVGERGCCGIINEESYDPIPGAVCHEHDIVGSNITSVDVPVNGSDAIVRYCTINNIVCDKFDKFSLESCLALGPFEIKDICSVEQIVLSTAGKSNGFVWSVFGIIVLILTMIHIGCDCFGCYDDSVCCQTVKWQGVCKITEIIVWVYVLVLVKIFVENAAVNGYVNDIITGDELQKEDVAALHYNSTSDTWVDERAAAVAYTWVNYTAFDFLQRQCGLPDDTDLLWIDFDDEIDGWVTVRFIDNLATFGIVVTLIDFCCFMVWCCCGDKCGWNSKAGEGDEHGTEVKQTESTDDEDDKEVLVQKQTETGIQMAETVDV